MDLYLRDSEPSEEDNHELKALLKNNTAAQELIQSMKTEFKRNRRRRTYIELDALMDWRELNVLFSKVHPE